MYSVYVGLIDRYDFGSIVVNGVEYHRDIITIGEKVIPNWWREEGHRLKVIDVTKYIDLNELNIEVVVIGTGYYGYMVVDDELLELFRKKGWEVYVYRTGEAVKIYNKLLNSGRKLLGLFHLTC